MGILPVKHWRSDKLKAIAVFKVRRNYTSRINHLIQLRFDLMKRNILIPK